MLPLIAKDQLPDTAHCTIIEQMVAGGIGNETEIVNAIESGDYSYLTATYYLLAERVLSSYRQDEANRLLAMKADSNDEGYEWLVIVERFMFPELWQSCIIVSPRIQRCTLQAVAIQPAV